MSQSTQPQPATSERNVSFLLGIGILLLPLIFVWFLLREGHSLLARIVGFGYTGCCVLLAIGMLSAGASAVSSTVADTGVTPSAENRQVESSKQLPQYTASDLAKAYEENTVAANNKFKGERFIVSGSVSSINTDFLDRPYFTLEGGVNPFLEPQFRLKRGHEDYAASVHTGDTIYLACTGAGDVAKTPMNKDCVPTKAP